MSERFVLIPVASIGCGKTTVAVALARLFNWGHVQNDDKTGRKRREWRYARRVAHSLGEHQVVIADRNNYQRQKRERLMSDVSRLVPEVQFIALHYVHSPKDQLIPLIRNETTRRVISRGDQHQTLMAGSRNLSEILRLIDYYLHAFEPVEVEAYPDSKLNHVIALDVLEGSAHALRVIVNDLQTKFPGMIRQEPSLEQLSAALSWAVHVYPQSVKQDANFRTVCYADGEQPSSKAQESIDFFGYYRVMIEDV